MERLKKLIDSLNSYEPLPKLLMVLDAMRQAEITGEITLQQELELMNYYISSFSK